MKEKSHYFVVLVLISLMLGTCVASTLNIRNLGDSNKDPAVFH